MNRLLLLGALAACAGGGDEIAGPPDAPQPQTCMVSILQTPELVIAGPDSVVRLDASVTGLVGVPTFTWHVRRGGTQVATAQAAPDHSGVTFVAAELGIYEAFARVDAAGVFCPEASLAIEVKPAGAGEGEFRVRIVPPDAADVPPLEKRIVVQGGPEDLVPPLILEPGLKLDGMLVADGQPVAGYLRFENAGAGTVEAFATNSGAFSAVIANVAQSVLVLPSSPLAPPQVVTWDPGMTTFALRPGSVVTGVVRDGTDAALPGAGVKLVIDGTPSTTALSNAAGEFSMRVDRLTGSVVKFVVTPPDASGLPRLLATATTPDLSQPITIRYGATTIRDLAGTSVRRGAAPLAHAAISLVGTWDNAGTVAAPTQVSAQAELRATSATNQAGVLPSLRVPAAAMSAVVTATPGDRAVIALDLTSAVPPVITAPAMVTRTVTLRDPAGIAIAGATLDMIPRGALDLAGAPMVRMHSAAGGQLTAMLASGGEYELRIHDRGMRGALAIVPSVGPTTIAASYELAQVTRVTSSVIATNPVVGASVQILCAYCDGLERDRAIAEGVTNAAGGFTLPVPEPRP